jgi:hypothetical protein
MFVDQRHLNRERVMPQTRFAPMAADAAQRHARRESQHQEKLLEELTAKGAGPPIAFAAQVRHAR